MFWTKTWQNVPRWLHSRRRSRNLSVRWIGKSNLHQNQIGKSNLHQNQIGKNYLHQNQNQIIKNNLHQNQAFVVRCEGKSLFWKSWSKQILKLSLKCQTCPGQDLEHEGEIIFSAVYHGFALLLSFAKTMSGLWLLPSVVQPGHRFAPLPNQINHFYSDGKLISILGDHLAGDEQSRHCNGKSKGFERSVSLPVEFSQIPRPVRHPVKPLTILYKSTNMYLTYINKYLWSHYTFVQIFWYICTFL